MLKLLSGLFSGKDRAGAAETPDVLQPIPDEVSVEGLTAFPIAKHVSLHRGFPIVDWNAAGAWLDSVEPGELQSKACAACERAWLLRAAGALGPQHRLTESDGAMLLSSLAPNLAQATLEYMDRTRKRILGVLDGIAQWPPLGKAILIVFDDQDSYYSYVSYYYPEDGEFALSGGMHIDYGCGHYVIVQADLRSIEPVIAHEMTHGCLGHLSIPAWLNEGIAVNTERRLAGGRSVYPPSELRDKHIAFWGAAEIQEFWSGKSFLRADDGNMLSYDLASVMVQNMAKDWDRFKPFVLAADRADSGAAAALEHLGADLGDIACALLEKEPSADWRPQPEKWEGEPEKGGFALW